MMRLICSAAVKVYPASSALVSSTVEVNRVDFQKYHLIMDTPDLLKLITAMPPNCSFTLAVTEKEDNRCEPLFILNFHRFCEN
ncbi:MAG: hypothetical protein LBB63_02645 [Holosporaceae bacterium]|jgi:hypothetical protein|nr:hypothetical protein [Holosporaceae bacterium]